MSSSTILGLNQLGDLGPVPSVMPWEGGKSKCFSNLAKKTARTCRGSHQEWMISWKHVQRAANFNTTRNVLVVESPLPKQCFPRRRKYVVVASSQANIKDFAFSTLFWPGEMVAVMPPKLPVCYFSSLHSFSLHSTIRNDSSYPVCLTTIRALFQVILHCKKTLFALLIKFLP